MNIKRSVVFCDRAMVVPKFDQDDIDRLWDDEHATWFEVDESEVPDSSNMDELRVVPIEDDNGRPILVTFLRHPWHGIFCIAERSDGEAIQWIKIEPTICGRVRS